MGLAASKAVSCGRIGDDHGPIAIVEHITYDHDKRVISVKDASKSFDIDIQDVIAAIPLISKADDCTAFDGKGYALTFIPNNDTDSTDATSVDEFDIQHILISELPQDLRSTIVPFASTSSVPQDPEDAINVNPIRVIISTLSGACQADAFHEKALRKLLAMAGYHIGINCIVHATTSAKSILEITENYILPDANKGEEQRIILMSGDGGIVDLVNVLSLQPHSAAYKPPAVSILPFGTGNALAHSIGITNDRTSGLSILARGSPKQLPLFRATFSAGARLLADEATREEELPIVDEKPTVYGAVVCSWGMHAGLVADSDTKEYRKFGVDRFKMAAKEALYPSDGSPPHEYTAKVSILPTGSDTWEAVPREEHMYVLATMVSNLEKTFTISPASKPLSGRLRLVHFGPTTADEVMRVMGLAYQGGKHVDDPLVGYEDIDGMRIEFEGKEADCRWRRICVDGKIIRLEEDGWVEILKENRRVVDVVSL